VLVKYGCEVQSDKMKGRHYTLYSRRIRNSRGECKERTLSREADNISAGKQFSAFLEPQNSLFSLQLSYFLMIYFNLLEPEFYI